MTIPIRAVKGYLQMYPNGCVGQTTKFSQTESKNMCGNTANSGAVAEQSIDSGLTGLMLLLSLIGPTSNETDETAGFDDNFDGFDDFEDDFEDDLDDEFVED